MIVRPYRDADLDGVHRLFDIRGLAFDRDMFLWKKQCPGQLSCVAERGGVVLGHFCVLRLPLPFASGEHVAGFGVDGIFHPEHSKMDVIGKVFALAAEMSRAAGLEALFGFPNARMAATMTFLGWKEAARFDWIVSSGGESTHSQPRLPLDSFNTPYEAWRWERGPRRSRVYEGMGLRALFGELANIGDVLLRIDMSSGVSEPSSPSGEGPLESLARRYSFACLKEEGAPMPGSFSLAPVGAGPVLMSRPLDLPSSTREIAALPAVWYLESLEAVTLGW